MQLLYNPIETVYKYKDYFHLKLRTSGVKGRVEVNGYERQNKTFRKHSAYITYEDNLSGNLTVEEYLLVAAQLKMGNKVEMQKKQSMVKSSKRTIQNLYLIC